MVMNIYSMHDRLNGYFNIFIDKSDEIAKRGFTASFKEADKGSLFYSCPEDYSLWKLGEIDLESGVITALPTPQFLIRGEKNDNIERPTN